MAVIEVENANLLVKMQGTRKFLTLKSELSIPLEHVVDIETDETAWQDCPEFGEKRVGTDAYGLYFGGSFVQNGDKVFYDLKHKERAVAVTLKDEEYARLIVGVDDPAAAVETVWKYLL